MTAAAFQALYLQHNALPTDTYQSLKFWINGGVTGGQTLNVIGLLNNVAQPAMSIGPLAAGAWQEVVIPLSQPGPYSATVIQLGQRERPRHDKADDVWGDDDDQD